MTYSFIDHQKEAWIKQSIMVTDKQQDEAILLLQMIKIICA